MGVHAVEVATLGDFGDGGRLGVEIDGLCIALFRDGDHLRAVDNVCMRCGASLLDGEIVGGRLACPGCDGCYALDNGGVSGNPALHLHTFRVWVVEGRVLLDVAGPVLG